MLVWGGPLAVSGEGSTIRAGDWFRLEVTSYPAWQSKSGDVPPRFYSLGLVGTISGDYRSPGIRLTYERQGAIPLEGTALAIYWALPFGVGGNLYQGVDVSGIPAFGAIVKRTTAFNVANDTPTPTEFDLDVYDPWGMHDPASNPERVTVPAPGTYHVSYQMYWGANGAGVRLVQLKRNGAELLSELREGSPGAGEFTLQAQWSGLLDANDYVSAVLFQNSGGDLLAFPDSNSLRLAIWRLTESQP